MKNIFLIFCGVLAGIILFQFLFYSCEKKKLNKTIALKEAAIQACINAPVTSDTVTVTHFLKDTIYLKYTYRVTDTVHESEAVDWEAETIEQRAYSGTYEDPQFFVNWSAKITGTLDELTINPPSLIKGLEITKTKTVDLTDYQTDKPAKERAHLYTSMAVCTDFKGVNGIDINLMYLKKLGVIAGLQTDFERMNFRAGIVVRLK